MNNIVIASGCRNFCSESFPSDFNLLNDSCFILIAPFDIFGRGLYRYTFEEVCRECPDLKLDDGRSECSLIRRELTEDMQSYI